MNGMPYEEWYKKNVMPIINQSWLDAGYTQEQIDSGEALRLSLEESDVKPYPWLADAVAADEARERETEEAELAAAG